MPAFTRHIAVNYSGAETPAAMLPSLRIAMSEDGAPPVEIPPPALRRWWRRKDIAEWLAARLEEDRPTLVGLDHGFSFPWRYFAAHGLAPDWPTFLEDFQRHWPTDGDNTYVDFVREGIDGDGAARGADRRWRRLTEERSGAKPVLDFDVVGSVAKATYAGLPWILFLRRRLGARLHIWPFDGWRIPNGVSALVELRAEPWTRGRPRGALSRDQHDALVMATELVRADREGQLAALLDPDLSLEERQRAGIEGWILGAGTVGA
jgi:hypothetical protein